jgi:mannose-6-phosphate isomerase-like protein (cupin superfamily)
MQAFDISQLLENSRKQGDDYFEFLRVPAMSLGIYRLAAGSQDLQSPHKQDEIYFVQEGHAQIEVEGITQSVRPGSIVYVPALAQHHFKEITEDLELLVFFAPAEAD